MNWWLVVLYPPSLPNDADPFLASIRLPTGWKYNTSLPFDGAPAADTVQFKVVSWNGKYRTPVGLDIKTYQDPMQARLIWVYEGLTDYISNIVAARSGFWNEDQLAQSLAIDAAQMTYHTGRTWRSLQDTTIGAQMLLVSPNSWVSARRNVDFYPESGLMWLEADTIIRERSGGRRSLDDFCKLFLGPLATSKPYVFDDIVAAMNTVLPYDWKSFFHSHLDSLSAEPPLGGIERSGWKLVYTDQKSELVTDMEQILKVDLLWPEWQTWGFADLRSSIGLLVQDDGTVLDSAPSLAGYDVGIMPGMLLTGVNGAPFSLATLEASVRGTRDGGDLELEVANGKSSAVRRLDYHGGLRYPHLQRDPTKPDLLREIVAAQATQASAR